VWFGKPNFRAPSFVWNFPPDVGVVFVAYQGLKMLLTPMNLPTRYVQVLFLWLADKPSRSQSKSFHDNPPTNIVPLPIENGQNTQRRFALPERLPSSVSSTTPTFAA
jgi:hypothetical protein